MLSDHSRCGAALILISLEQPFHHFVHVGSLSLRRGDYSDTVLLERASRHFARGGWLSLWCGADSVKEILCNEFVKETTLDKRGELVCGSWKRSCRDTASSKTLAQNSGDSCLERVFLISEKGQSLEILNFFGVCGSLSVVCPMTSVARCGQAILVCFDIADALNIALFLVTSQLLAGDLKTTKNPLYYWQTLIKYEHCDEFFTYYPKYNDYVAMQSVRDDTTSDKEFCVVEGDTYPPKFCSTFPPDFQKETLKLVIRDCKNTLCELAQSGKWKAGWFKQGKAKKMPWPREMQKDGHQSLGYEDAFPEQLFRVGVGLPILDGGLTWANQQSDGDIWGIIL